MFVESNARIRRRGERMRASVACIRKLDGASLYQPLPFQKGRPVSDASVGQVDEIATDRLLCFRMLKKNEGALGGAGPLPGPAGRMVFATDGWTRVKARARDAQRLRTIRNVAANAHLEVSGHELLKRILLQDTGVPKPVTKVVAILEEGIDVVESDDRRNTEVVSGTQGVEAVPPTKDPCELPSPTRTRVLAEALLT